MNIRDMAAAAADQVDDTLATGTFAADPMDQIAAAADPIVDEGPSIDILGILLRRTGEGSVESYRDHVLNFDQKDSTGRIIRGLTGMFDKDLNLAIVDLGMGVMQKMRGE